MLCSRRLRGWKIAANCGHGIQRDLQQAAQERIPAGLCDTGAWEQSSNQQASSRGVRVLFKDSRRGPERVPRAGGLDRVHGEGQRTVRATPTKRTFREAEI